MAELVTRNLIFERRLLMKSETAPKRAAAEAEAKAKAKATVMDRHIQTYLRGHVYHGRHGRKMDNG